MLGCESSKRRTRIDEDRRYREGAALARHGREIRQRQGRAAAELLARVQQYHTGYLWVPRQCGEMEERDDRIRRAHADGTSVPEIAKRFSLSERRVWQIVDQQAHR